MIFFFGFVSFFSLLGGRLNLPTPTPAGLGGEGLKMPG